MSGFYGGGTGINDTSALHKTNNLSDVNSASTARTNLGLGTAATHANTDYLLSSTITTAGDLIVGTGAGTYVRLAKGADGKVLTMVAGSVAWADPSGGGGSSVLLAPSTTQVIQSTSDIIPLQIKQHNSTTDAQPFF